MAAQRLYFREFTGRTTTYKEAFKNSSVGYGEAYRFETATLLFDECK